MNPHPTRVFICDFRHFRNFMSPKIPKNNYFIRSMEYGCLSGVERPAMLKYCRLFLENISSECPFILEIDSHICGLLHLEMKAGDMVCLAFDFEEKTLNFHVVVLLMGIQILNFQLSFIINQLSFLKLSFYDIFFMEFYQLRL